MKPRHFLVLLALRGQYIRIKSLAVVFLFTITAAPASETTSQCRNAK
jgi:hypothetical protein